MRRRPALPTGRGPLGRRTVIVGSAAALVGLAGCSSDRDDSSPGDGGSTSPGDDGSGGSGDSGEDAGDDEGSAADERLVADVVTALSSAHALVRRARRTPAGRGELADQLQALERLHRLHAVELGGLGRARARALSGDAPAVRRRVLAAERRLQRTLGAAVLDARSGALAGLLASMEAGLAQYLGGTPT